MLANSAYAVDKYERKLTGRLSMRLAIASQTGEQANE